MYTFEATVKTGNMLQKARVVAAGAIQAKAQFEAQYGKGNVLSVPVKK